MKELSKGYKQYVRDELGKSRRELEDQTIRDNYNYAVDKLLSLFELSSEDLSVLEQYWKIKKARCDDGLDLEGYRERMEDLGYKIKQRPDSAGLYGGLRYLDSIFSKRY